MLGNTRLLLQGARGYAAKHGAVGQSNGRCLPYPRVLRTLVLTLCRTKFWEYVQALIMNAHLPFIACLATMVAVMQADADTSISVSSSKGPCTAWSLRWSISKHLLPIYCQVATTCASWRVRRMWCCRLQSNIFPLPLPTPLLPGTGNLILSAGSNAVEVQAVRRTTRCAAKHPVVLCF